MARTRKRSRRSSTESPKGSKRSKRNHEQEDEQPQDPVLQEEQYPSPTSGEPEQEAAPEPTQQSDTAAQHEVDPAHITQARQWIQREALSRFFPLFDAAQAIVGNTWSDYFIPYGQLLDNAQVQVPISIVTESIKWRLNRRDSNQEGEPRFFDVIDDGRIDVAKFDSTIGTRTARPGRPLLFAWIYNPQHHTVTSAQDQDANLGKLVKDMQQGDQDHRSHIFLLMVRMNEGLCEIRIYDSYRLQFRDDPVIWPSIVRAMKIVIRNLKWFPEELEGEVPEDVDADSRFGPEVEVRVATQSQDWACGLHTILNAWTIAMNLIPNPDFAVDPRNPEGFYHTAINMVNLVISRAVNSNLLYAFLVGHAYALPSKLRDQCPSFPAPEKDTFRTGAELADHVELAHNIYDFEKLEGRHDFQSKLLPESPPPPKKSRKAGPPRPLRPSTSRLQQEESRPGIDPAVMAESVFATSDCMSFWHHLNRSTKRRLHWVQQDNRASVDGMDDFIWYICKTLDREKTINMSVIERKAWFTTEQRLFNQALSFPVENEKPMTEKYFFYLRRQMFYLRKMAAGQYITAPERMQLVAEYGRFEGKAPPGIANAYAALWSRSAVVPPRPVAPQIPQQQGAAPVPQQSINGPVSSHQAAGLVPQQQVAVPTPQQQVAAQSPAEQQQDETEIEVEHIDGQFN